MRVLIAQCRHEIALLARNGEQLLLTLGIPVMVLVFFSLVDVLPINAGQPVDFLLPGVIALAVMSSAMVSLGISTGFERTYHVLKRLGATPLGRGRLVAAKALTVVVVEAVQSAVLVAVAVALGWSPGGADWLVVTAAIVLGTLAFAGIGLLMAGRLRGELNLAAQNGLYLVLLLLSGMVVPSDELPTGLATPASMLPSTALADAVRAAAAGGAVDPRVWLVLTGWSLAMPLLAARLFRWD